MMFGVEKNTQFIECLEHPDLPMRLEEFDAADGTAMCMAFCIYPGRFADGSPSFMWTATLGASSLFLAEFFPGVFDKKDEEVVTIAKRANLSLTHLLDDVSRLIPRVAWYWLAYFVIGVDQSACQVLDKELSARFPETRGRFQAEGWIEL